MKTEGKKIFSSIVAVSAVVVLVLLSPFFDLSFSLHMLFHVLLMYLLAPALLGAQFFLWTLPESAKAKMLAQVGKIRPFLNFVTHPLIALVLSSGALWLGHIPVFYDSALQNEALHVTWHLIFLVTFLFYWSPLVDSSRRLTQLHTNESRVLYILIGAMQGMILGAFIAFSGNIIYANYSNVSHFAGLSPIVDQQIGGIVMLLVGSIAYCMAGTLCLKRE